MKKDRLYLYTFLAIGVLFLLIATVSVNYFVRVSTLQLLDTQLQSSKGEAKAVAALVGQQFELGMSKEKVIANVQDLLESNKSETGFISVFDWSGKEICHPDKTQLGQQISADQSQLNTMEEEMSADDFYAHLDQRKKEGTASAIIYLKPVPHSDWIVGAHAQTDAIYSQIKALRTKFNTAFLLIGLIAVLGSVLAIRFISSLYERQMEDQNQRLESEVFNLAKLNADLSLYQQKVSGEPIPEVAEVTDVSSDKGKKRILTYSRNELLPVSTEQIAYIFTENTVTYVVDLEGKQTIANSSLDELFASLDGHFFYRANRQVIVAISAIKRILKYGNNQLKIQVAPESNFDIIISKNKASEFKSWLNS